ncbi:MAG: hypothetical protein Q9226_003226 [Calogaya cf. arnoldii]
MDGVSIAASLVGLGTAGCQIAIKLYTLASQISTASQRISSVSNDVSLTAGILKELGEFMTRETANDSTSIFSQSGLETTKNSAAVCETIFSEIEQAAKEASEQLRTKTRIIGKIKLSKSEKLKWPFLQPSIESLRIDLREAKGTLMLMLQVTNLALSQKMATINGTPRVISPPPPLASPTDTQKTSPPDNKTTLGSPTIAGQSVASLNPQTLIAASDPPVLQESELEAPTKNLSSGPLDNIDDAQFDGTHSNSSRSSSGGSNTRLPNTTIRDQREYSELMYLIVKACIKDDKKSPRGISLRFHWHRIPMQQVDIRKRLLSSKEEGFQPVLKAYLDLFDHERFIIEELIDDMESRASLLLLKRTYTDMTYREILFRGVPELQFVLEISTKEEQHGRHMRHAPSRSSSRSEVIELASDTSRPRRQAQRETIEVSQRARSKEMYLAQGYSEETIEILVQDAEEKKRQGSRGGYSPHIPHSPQNLQMLHGHNEQLVQIKEQMNVVNLNKPTYVKVHRKHLSPDTLDAYDLPWEWDTGDSDYIIIKRWIDEDDQDKLFEHTRKLREERQQRSSTSAPVELKKEASGNLNLAREKSSAGGVSRHRSPRRWQESWGFPKPVSMRRDDELSDVDVRGMSEPSEDSSEDSTTPDDEDAMNDEEAEKAVKELLGKYTTLGAVAGEGSGGTSSWNDDSDGWQKNR